MNGVRGSFLAGIAAAFALAACRDVAGPSPLLSRHQAVYAVVEVGSSEVRVLAEELLESGTRPLQGAEGTVSGAAGPTVLAEAVPGAQPCLAVGVGASTGGEDGCYFGQLPAPLGAAEAVRLAMSLPGGGSVRGSLVTPDLPQASIPPDSQRVTVAFQSLPPDMLPIAIVPIVLDAAPGAGRVDVVATVVGAYRFQGGGATIDPSLCEVRAATDPFREPSLRGQRDFFLHDVTCRELGAVVAWDSLQLAVHVVAMEENYATYFDRILASSSIDVDRAGFGVEGAVGVFGAVATTVLPLTVVFDCTIVVGCL